MNEFLKFFFDDSWHFIELGMVIILIAECAEKIIRAWKNDESE